jgi:hypothetical protein
MVIAEGATEVRLGSDGRFLHRESRVRVRCGGAGRLYCGFRVKPPIIPG